jgi:hypothetical protein
VGCGHWSATVREKRKVRVFEGRVLKRAFGPKREEVRETGENYTVRSFMICASH